MELLSSGLTMKDFGLAAARVSLSMLPLMLLALASLRVLGSAATRDRLSGGTFRMLSLAILATFATVLLHACFQTGKLLLLLLSGASIVTAWRQVLGLAVTIATSVPAIRASYAALEANGLPKFKTAIRATKGSKAFLTIVAVCYAVTAVHQVIWGGALLLYSNLKTLGALRCFIVAACAHVCQTAAVAGPKRLSSETYKLLNLALMLDGIVCLATVALLGASSSSTAGAYALVGAAPTLAFFSAASGFVVGTRYRAE